MRKKTLKVYVKSPSNISINHEGRMDRSVATEIEGLYNFVEHAIPQIENAERLQEIPGDMPAT